MPSSIRVHTACLGSHLVVAITASYSSYSLAHRLLLSVTTRSPSGSGRASGSRRLAITSAHLSVHTRAQLQLLLACVSLGSLFLSYFFSVSIFSSFLFLLVIRFLSF
ncbi:hypothetical protein V8C43DRAFT_274473 [Trichoderma afarasin]